MAETNRTISITAKLKDQITGSLRNARQAFKDIRQEINQTNQSAGAGKLNQSMAQFSLSAKSALGTLTQIKTAFSSTLTAAANGVTAAFGRSRVAANQAGQAAAGAFNATKASLKAASLSVVSFTIGVAQGGAALLKAFGTNAIKAVSGLTIGIQKSLGGAINTARRALTSFYGVVLQLLAAFTIGGLVDSLGDTAKKLDAIAKAAVRLGFNTPGQQSSFAALVIGAEQLGIELTTLDASFRVFGRNISKAARGGAVEAARAFNEIGIDFETLSNDLTSGSKTVTEALGDVAEALKNVSAQRQIDIVTILFGEVGPKFLLLIRNGREGINDLIRLTQAVSNNFDEETLNNVQSLVEAFRTLRTIFFGLQTSLLSAFALPLRGLINQIGAVVIGIRKAAPEIKTFMENAAAGFSLALQKGIDLTSTLAQNGLLIRDEVTKDLTEQQLKQIAAAANASTLVKNLLQLIRSFLLGILRLSIELSITAVKTLALEAGKILANTLTEAFLKATNLVLRQLKDIPFIGAQLAGAQVDETFRPFSEDTTASSVANFLTQAQEAMSSFTTELKNDAQPIVDFLDSQFGLIQKIKESAGLIDEFEALQASLRRVQEQTERSQSGIERFFAAAKQGFSDVIAEMSNLEIQGRNLGDVIGRGLTDGIIDPLQDVIFEVQTAKEAFRAFFFDLFKQISRIITQILLAKALGAVLSAFSPAGAATGVGVEAVQGLNDGGLVKGARTHRDSVLIAATPHEFMQPEATVDHYGLAIMEALRKRMIPRSVLSQYARGISAPQPKFHYNTGGSVRVPNQTSQPILAVGEDFMEQLLSSGGPVLERWLASKKGRIGTAS